MLAGARRFDRGIQRCSWLPLAADPEIWCDEPRTLRTSDVGFVGNIWDLSRAKALELLLNNPKLKVAFRGHGSVWKEHAAQLLRTCKIGFNINSWFGESYAYDLNMRVFETLSCGVPLITNAVPALAKIFPADAPFIRTYTSLDEIPPLVEQSLHDQAFLDSGSLGRKFILENATYELRLKPILDQIPPRGE